MKKWSISTFIIAIVFALVVVPLLFDQIIANSLAFLIKDSLMHGLVSGLILAASITLLTFYLILFKEKGNLSSLGVKTLPLRHFKTVIVWSFIQIIIGILYVLILETFAGGSANAKTESLESQTLMMFLLAFTSAAIISPIYEELFYRGLIYTWLRQRVSILPAMLISATIFTVVHIPTYNTLPINFIGGLIAAWVYEKTGAILSSILVHASFNGLAVAITYFFS
ncbi:CPBP family intramembrane glutamic endopeptidase [Jeotgalibacillus salarius]|uniref:CPBP family intramembrane metalloprotease n=1 Tax=Jeotgalibacillus salarius TaxID=546023 RepID=A0A4Y8LA18_9BACL|nr:type II CAAX endopeptidase family protein [Jeotgalibacillus salarius]TFD99495.1 CPBP family intramembrane metalloprotease [Jeotgalibacillus salarius]